jgi:hypothetical protein
VHPAAAPVQGPGDQRGDDPEQDGVDDVLDDPSPVTLVSISFTGEMGAPIMGPPPG